MCLGVPAVVVSVRALDNGMREATVKLGGITSRVVVVFSDDLKPGDYVIVHAGMAISKIDESEVKSILELWREIEEAIGAAEQG